MKKYTSLEKAWILYDVGNSAFTLLVSTIIPIYFNYLAEEAGLSSVAYLAYWGYAASVATPRCGLHRSCVRRCGGHEELQETGLPGYPSGGGGGRMRGHGHRHHLAELPGHLRDRQDRLFLQSCVL